MKPDFTKMELIPAIIQDYKTNEVLMLAYVNEEAYQKMLETNQTCFYSRSRNGGIKVKLQGIFKILKECI